MPAADPRRILERLEQLHVPINHPAPSAWTTAYVICATCGTAYPCRERRILDGHEEEL